MTGSQARKLLFRGRWLDIGPKPRTVEWRVNGHTYRRFHELTGLWEEFPIGSDEALAVEDEIRSLPGFPTRYDPDRDTIQVVNMEARV